MGEPGMCCYNTETAVAWTCIFRHIEAEGSGSLECLVVLPDAIADVIGDAGAGVSRAELQGRSLLLKHVDRLWVYTADGRLARHSAEAPERLSLENLTPGVYVVRMQYGNVVRSQQIRVE